MLYGNNCKEETSMKKILAFGLSLMLLCGCAAFAAAEGKTEMGVLEVTDAFTLQCSLPEGYWLNPTDTGSDHYRAVLMPQDGSAGKPMMTISIQFDELMSDVDRLNDLDSETLSALEATFREEDDVEISYMETTYGTRLMVVREIKDGTEPLSVEVAHARGTKCARCWQWKEDVGTHAHNDICGRCEEVLAREGMTVEDPVRA